MYIFPLSIQVVEIRLIFTIWAVVSETRSKFQTRHIWAWNTEFEKSSRSCTLTLFLAQGVEIELIFSLRIPETAAVYFSDTGQFSKFTYMYLGMKPGIWKKFQKLHMDPYTTPKGSKLSLFSLYGQPFPSYGAFFKIAMIVGHDVIEKSSRTYIWAIFLPQRVEIELMFAVRAWFDKIHVRVIFFLKVLEVAYGPIYSLRGSKLNLFPYLGKKSGTWEKSSRSFIRTLFLTPGGLNWA